MKKTLALAAMLAATFAAGTGAAMADASTVRLAKQYGISYLPLTVMQKQGLIEKQAQEDGLELTTEWLRFTGGSGMNEALLSQNLDIAAGGVGPMVTLWSRTLDNYGFKGLGTLGNMPIYLVTTNPDIKSLADFDTDDKIALPAVKTSIQAVTLQMAALKELGEGHANDLDNLTVSMGHPDAQLALLGGGSGITAHFGSPPFQNLELEDERAHKVVDSYEVLGGPHTFNVIWASQQFVDDNPIIAQAVQDALGEAIEFIKANPEEAAEIWMEDEKTTMSKEAVVALLTDEQVEWTSEPENILPYVNYMNESGLIDNTTDDMADLFFQMDGEAAAN